MSAGVTCQQASLFYFNIGTFQHPEGFDSESELLKFTLHDIFSVPALALTPRVDVSLLTPLAKVAACHRRPAVSIDG